MAQSPGRSLIRLDGIDLLRTLAIFFVLMNHVNVRLSMAKVPFKQGLPYNLVHGLFYNGQNGVRIFFAISGFLITSMAMRRWGSLAGIDIRRFYVLRFARIAPLLLLLLAVLSALHFAHFKDFVVSEKRGGFWYALLAALTFHINWREATTGYLPGSWDILWSLSVEEVFYLGFPLVCRWFRGRWLVVVLLAFVVTGPFARTILAHGNALWADYSYLSGMDAIALGCLTAIFLAERQLPPRALWASAIAGAGMLMAILGFSIEVLDKSGLDMTVLAVGTCLLIVPAAQGGFHIAGTWLTLGQRSYEVYLTHMFVVFSFFNWFVSEGRPMWAVPWLFGAVILVAGGVGEIVGRFYSEPMNSWLRERSGLGGDSSRRMPSLHFHQFLRKINYPKD
jgi:peptidoglycan/LPS O-acetylase OafA/YrhL